MKTVVLSLITLLAASSAGAQASYSMSVTVTANGKTTEREALRSFRFDSVTPEVAKATKLRPVRIEKTNGPSDGILQLSAQMGGKIRSLIFSVADAAGAQHSLLLSTVTVVSAQNMQAPPSGARPAEVIVIRYESMEVDGKPGLPENTYSWNAKK